MLGFGCLKISLFSPVVRQTYRVFAIVVLTNHA
jgi:hypothetical protein